MNIARRAKSSLIVVGVASSLTTSSEAQTDSWERLASLERGTRVVVHLDSEQVDALFRRASATHLYVITGGGRISEFEAVDVRAVYQMVPGPLARRMLIGAAITGGIMLYPCGIAPQANGSATGCRAITFVWGAGFGLVYHFLKRYHREAVYVARNETAATFVGDWRGESSDALMTRLEISRVRPQRSARRTPAPNN